MRALILVHRWLGVAFCLLFAMWFASGMVMHFVPFPTLTDQERIGGLAPIDPHQVAIDPATAIRRSGFRDVKRVRLLEGANGPIYVVHGDAALRAIPACNVAAGWMVTPDDAMRVAREHARRRGLDASRATFVEAAMHDQWTVPNALDPHRPLLRVALGDPAGTELYVSSMTGEVVRDTVLGERAWNYAGSVVHWIYPTVLRRDWRLWDATVWSLSLVALIGVASGAVLGVLRIRFRRGGIGTPFRGWHAWHHVGGLGVMVFLLTWMFSGWLSMDHGRLFSTGHGATFEESLSRYGDGGKLLADVGIDRVPPGAREVEWFAFGGRVMRRSRWNGASQDMVIGGSQSEPHHRHLQADDIARMAARISPTCGPPTVVGDNDDYAFVSSMPGAPAYRIRCGLDWFHIDGASGAVVEKLDPSRRLYRWAYRFLHTVDHPELARRPVLRSALILTLCSAGFAFSFTGIVLGWRRLKAD